MCFFAYSISYIGKYSYSTNIQNVINEFGVTKAYAGYVTSAFFFCYGIGQLVNGILCEKLNSKWTITLSLCISAVITFVMFFLKSILAMAILWGVNGLILSTLWCHSIKLLATIKEKSYMTKSVTVMSITLPVGVVSAYGCSALFTYFKVWKIDYLFSAILLLVIGIVFFFIVGQVEERQDNPKEKVEKEKQEGKNIFQMFGLMVVPLLLISIGAGLIRDGSSTWMPVLLGEMYALPDYFSILLTLGLPLMGVFTAMISTRLIKITKRVFGSCFVAGIGGILVTAVLVVAFKSSFILLIVLFMILSVAGYVLANTITSILPLYYKGELKSGQAAGLTNACVYLGSTFSSLFLGGLVDQSGWQAFMIFMFACTIIITVMSILGIVVGKRTYEKRGNNNEKEI